MRDRTLGNTGVKVSELCLGAMMFGRMGNRDHDDSVAIIHKALDAGINFVDTADVYSRGESETIVESRWAAERRGIEPFRTEQPPYSIFARRIEGALLPTCERYGMGVLVWSPLNGGWLTGRYSRGDVETTGRMQRMPQRFDLEREDNRRKLELCRELESLAADAGTDLIGLALGFVLAHPAVSTAIIGPRTMEQLDGILASGAPALDDDVLDRIDELVPPGTDVSAADGGWVPPWIAQSWRRRRPLAAR